MDNNDKLIDVSAKPKKLFRTRDDKFLAGVLGGLGNYFNIHPLIVRMVFVLVLIPFHLAPILLVAYIAAWALVPEAQIAEEKRFSRLMPKLRRSRKNRMVAGICGGLAHYYKQDVSIIRIGMVFLGAITGGIMVLVYIALWLYIPEEEVA